VLWEMLLYQEKWVKKGLFALSEAWISTTKYVNIAVAPQLWSI